jgi:hypothetical protein
MKFTKRIIILLVPILFCVIYFFYECNTEDEKYTVINEIVIDNNLYFDRVCSKTIKIEVFKNNLSDFTLIDQLSVNLQKLTQISCDLKPNKLKYFSPRENKTKNCTIIKNCEEEYVTIYKISMPILSADKKTALIKIVEDCNCMLGGRGGVYLYKKINGKWKYIKSFSHWIS